jgi:hypothetical protein
MESTLTAPAAQFIHVHKHLLLSIELFRWNQLENATPTPCKLIQNRLANHSSPSGSPTRHTRRFGQFAPKATHEHRKSTHSAKRTEVALTGEPCRLRASRRSVTLPSEKGHLSSSAASIVVLFRPSGRRAGPGIPGTRGASDGLDVV